MAIIQTINVSFPNDGLGDTLRDSQIKANDNFAELNAKKVEAIPGQGLSDNNFTDADKAKLDGIEAGAGVQVQSNWNQNDPGEPDYIIGKPIDGKILVYGNYALVGNDLTIYAGWVWQIGNVIYTNTADIVINIPYASAGMVRIDLIIFNSSYSAERLEGIEVVSNPVTPISEENAVFFAICTVTDSTITISGVLTPAISSVDYVVTVGGTQNFAIPNGKTAFQVFVNGAQHWKLTGNNASRPDTWQQTDSTVTLLKTTSVNNYVVIYFQ